MKNLLNNELFRIITLIIGLPIYLIGMCRDLDLLLPIGVLFFMPTLLKIFKVIEEKSNE